MAETITVFRRVQIGQESTVGTAVACPKQLSASSIIATETIDTQVYTPIGQKFASKQTLNKDSTSLALTGVMSFRELAYQITMAHGGATITTPPGGTLSRQFKWTPSATTPQTDKSATLQMGDGVRVQQVPGNLATGYEFKYTRDTCEVSMPLTGWNTTDGSSFSSTPTIIGEAPIIGDMIDVYYDTTFGGIGVTQLTRVFEITFGVTDIRGVFWPMNRGLASWAASVDLLLKPTIKIKLEADSTGMGLLADARANSIKYLRIEAIGAIIEGAIPFSFVVDAQVAVVNKGAPSDTQGVWTTEFDLQIMNDGTNAPLSETLVTDITAL
jgi:hypothetical protein